MIMAQYLDKTGLETFLSKLNLNFTGNTINVLQQDISVNIKDKITIGDGLKMVENSNIPTDKTIVLKNTMYPTWTAVWVAKSAGSNVNSSGYTTAQRTPFVDSAGQISAVYKFVNTACGNTMWKIEINSDSESQEYTLSHKFGSTYTYYPGVCSLAANKNGEWIVTLDGTQKNGFWEFNW